MKPVAESMGLIAYRCRRCGVILGALEDEHGYFMGVPTEGCKCFIGPSWQQGTWVPDQAPEYDGYRHGDAAQ